MPFSGNFVGNGLGGFNYKNGAGINMGVFKNKVIIFNKILSGIFNILKNIKNIINNLIIYLFINVLPV